VVCREGSVLESHAAPPTVVKARRRVRDTLRLARSRRHDMSAPRGSPVHYRKRQKWPRSAHDVGALRGVQAGLAFWAHVRPSLSDRRLVRTPLPFSGLMSMFLLGYQKERP
jgi:hypothetical protein